MPACGPLQHLLQALPATRAVMQEVRHPGIDVIARDVLPGLPIPGAKVGLQQGVIDHVSPAQAAQVTTDSAATPKR